MNQLDYSTTYKGYVERANYFRELMKDVASK